jgi:hypothetical protein
MHKFWEVIVLTLTVAWITPVGAQTQQQFEWCNGKSDATSDLIIGGRAA